MKKRRGETKAEQLLQEYLIRLKGYYLYIRDNYRKLLETNTENDLDYIMRIYKSIYEQCMDEGFITAKQMSFVHSLKRQLNVLIDEDDILDMVEPETLTYDIEEE